MKLRAIILKHEAKKRDKNENLREREEGRGRERESVCVCVSGVDEQIYLRLFKESRSREYNSSTCLSK